MNLNLFGLELYFGRPRKEGRRETVQDFLGVFGMSWGGGFDKQTTAMKPNAVTLRQFAKGAIPRRAIHIIKNAVLGLPYQITVIDPTDTKEYTIEKKQIMNIITRPNPGYNYNDFWSGIIEDVLTGDCGSFEIVKNGEIEKPLSLYQVDGFTIEFVKGWNGKPDDIRFAQLQQGYDRVYFNDERLAYIRMDTFTHTPFGVSPIESAFEYINYLLNTQSYAGMASGKAIPKFILSLGETLDDKKVEAFRRYMSEEIYGTGDLPVVGGSKGIASHQIGAINDDGLFLEWQKFLITIIAYSFGVDPKKLGMGSATDRSTVEEQSETTLEEAVKPVAKVIAQAINDKVLRRLGYDKILKFEFIFEETLAQKKSKADIAVLYYTNDGITQNEFRELLGYQPLTSKYSDLTISEMKASINKDYQVGGGFNGVGKDRHENDNKGGEN